MCSRESIWPCDFCRSMHIFVHWACKYGEPSVSARFIISHCSTIIRLYRKYYGPAFDPSLAINTTKYLLKALFQITCSGQTILNTYTLSALIYHKISSAHTDLLHWNADTFNKKLYILYKYSKTNNNLRLSCYFLSF